MGTILMLGLALLGATVSAPAVAHAEALVVTGDAICVTVPPDVDLTDGTRQNDSIEVFHERGPEVLESTVLVDSITEGTFTTFDTTPTDSIPAGTLFQSYLLHFDPPPGSEETRRVATVRFDDEILGIIMTADTLTDTDEALGLSMATYDTGSRQRGADVVDFDEVSWFGNEIIVDLEVLGAVDQVRVIVSAEPIAVDSGVDSALDATVDALTENPATTFRGEGGCDCTTVASPLSSPPLDAIIAAFLLLRRRRKRRSLTPQRPRLHGPR